MKYIKYDMYDSNIEEEISRHIPYSSFLELDEFGYEKRRIDFYRSSRVGEQDLQIGFVDEHGCYLGSWCAEHPWRPVNYTKEGLLKVKKGNEGYYMSFAIEIKKEDFEKVWEVVVEQYLLKECGVERDKDDENLIDFNKLPEFFNEIQLEELAREYREDPNSRTFTWITENHLQQIKDFVEKNRK